MIASLHGTPSHVGLEHCLLVVGGVGLRVNVTPETAAELRVGQATTLATTLVVREESLTLYGFATDDERDLFETVQSVSGIGPRLALAMLSVHPPVTLVAALSNGDTATLTKVPGIGRKGAERLVLELRDKIAAPAAAERGTAGAPPAPEADSARGQVVEALLSLGWAAKQAEGATDAVLARVEGDVPAVPALLRTVLQELAR